MAKQKIPKNGFDAIDLSALWPCMAQIGCIPLTEMLSSEPDAPDDDEEE